MNRSETFTDWVIRQRWWVLGTALLLTLGAVMGAKNLVMKNDYRLFFSAENPQLRAFEALRQIYTKDDNVQLIVSAKEGSLFTQENMEALQWLTAQAWTELPFVTRVDSVTNFQHTQSEADDLQVGDLVPEGVVFSEAELAEMVRTARAEPLLYKRLIGDKDFVAGINVTMRMPELDASEAQVAANAARELLEKFEARYPALETRLTGVVMLNNAFGEAAVGDITTVMPIMFAVIFLICWLLIRSWAGLLGTSVVVFGSVMGAMGLMGWIGFPLSAPVSTAPTMIMTLAVADSIHILVTMLHEMRGGRKKREAIVESMRINFQPVFLTSITTAIGFLSMNFSDAPPFRHLGNVVAIGVMLAWLYSIFVLPAVMSLLPVRVRVKQEDDFAWQDRWANFVIARRRAVLWGSLLVIGGALLVIPRLQLNDQFVEYFGEDIEFRTDTDYTMANLTGIYGLEYSVESTESGGISQPEYLRHLDAFTQWFRGQEGVLQVVSFSDIIKRLNKNLHGDDEAYYRIPDEQELAAQYLLLFEMSLPYGLDLNNMINVDKSATRYTVVLDNMTTVQVRGLIEKANEWMSENLPETMRGIPASPMVMFSYISQRNIESMLSGTALAMLLISVLLGVALRSTRYGLISLLPNFSPAIVGFGVWTLLEGEMGMSLAPVTGMTLGIVVDDSVHFLSKYIRARREKLLSVEESIRYAFRQVGTALMVTTVILVSGFLVLSTSSFRLNGWMGELTWIVIAIALVLDLLFLPALLLFLDKKKK